MFDCFCVEIRNLTLKKEAGHRWVWQLLKVNVVLLLSDETLISSLRLSPTETWTTSGLATSGCPVSDYLSTAATSWSAWWTLACWTTWPRRTWGCTWRWWTASTGTGVTSIIPLPALHSRLFKPTFCKMPEQVYSTGSCVWRSSTTTGKSWRDAENIVSMRLEVRTFQI